jgi:hypothetical protein
MLIIKRSFNVIFSYMLIIYFDQIHPITFLKLLHPFFYNFNIIILFLYIQIKHLDHVHTHTPLPAPSVYFCPTNLPKNNCPVTLGYLVGLCILRQNQMKWRSDFLIRVQNLELMSRSYRLQETQHLIFSHIFT